MRLEDNFYKIKHIDGTTDRTFNAIVEIFHEHPIFKGHFPQQAIVPGVFTLTIIKECIGKVLHREISFTSIKECKYVSTLLPYAGLQIVLDFVIEDSKYLKGKVTRLDNKQVILKLKATL